MDDSEETMSAATDWLAELAALWAGGPVDHCQAKHGIHHTTVVETVPLGPLEVFAWADYENTEGFCEGNDEVSKSLTVNGYWERFGMNIADVVLTAKHPAGEVVLDFGSHIGVYTLQAAEAGFPCLALDASDEHLRVLASNAKQRNVSGLTTPCHGWIGADSPVCSLPPDEVRVRFLKSDLEGAEDHLLRIVLPLLERRLIDYALVEVSPIFADHYPDTVGRIMDCGYQASIVPLLDNETPERLDRSNLARQLDLDQRDVLFTLGEA
jgi:hypothetical protein